MNWTDDPATERQLIFLRDLGFKVARPLSRVEAARIIRQYQRNPLRPGAVPPSADLEPSKPRDAFDTPTPAPRFDPSALTPPGEPAAESMGTPQGTISHSTRMEARRLRIAVEDARQVMAQTPDAPNVRADMAASTARRQEFWLDTCRDVKEMQVGSVQVLELYQRYGCRLYGPSRPQVQEILDALDSAMPLWDRDHPELFFQTLELNFPDLAKKSR